MKTAVIVAVLGVVVIGAGFGVAYIAKKTRAPTTIVAQSPTPAVAGIQALGQLASKGIDAFISSRVSKDKG